MFLRNQKGFALALALFVAVGVLVAMSAGFLGMTRLQAQMARSAESIKTHWIAAAMLEAAVYEFEVQRKAAGTNAVNISDEVLQDIQDMVLAQARLSWADPGLTDLDTASGLGRYEKNIQITKTFVDGGYDYWVESYAKDTITKADNVIRQKIRLYAGSIFDFGVFYEHDLEITPGADMEIQGPIFSNGNIYLMSPVAVDVDSPVKLRIETPQSGIMDYALKSAGNIYFYNKPFLGRNYLLDSAFYSARVPSFYKHAKGIELTRKGSPLIYFARNAVLNIWNQKFPAYGASSWWVEEDCLKEIGGVMRDCGHHIELKSGAQIERLKFPGIPYDLSVYWSAHDTWDLPTHSNFSAYSYNNQSYPYENRASQKYMSFSGATDSLYSRISSDEIFFPTGSDHFSFAGTVNSGWAEAKTNLAQPVKFGRRIIDDMLNRVEIDLGKFDSDDADNHLIIEPITNLASVTSVDTDAQFSNDPRLAVKADAIFFCTDSSCSAIQARLTAPDDSQGPSNEDNDVILPASSLGATTGRCFDDKRLRARVHVLRVDLSVLTAYLLDGAEQKVSRLRPNAVVAYFETKSLRDSPLSSGEVSGFNNGSNVDQGSSSCSGPIRAVEFYNGAEAPVGGMTLVTNGRAWIQLDGGGVDAHFNSRIRDGARSECPVASWPNCDLPPVAIFSDSFGVDTHEVNVSRDHMINAAIVAGYVPSQLEKVYAGCDGSLANMSKCDVVRDDIFNHGAGSSWLASSQTIDPVTGFFRFGNGDAPDSSTDGYIDDDIPTKFPSGGWYGVVDCPAGLDLVSGQPIDPQSCFNYWDSTTGIYYLRRAWIYQWFYKRMVAEYNNYQATKTAWEAKPAGVGNVYKELSAHLATLPAFDATMQANASSTISGLLSGGEDFSAANALNDLKADLPGLLDAQGVFKLKIPLFGGAKLLSYEVRPPSDPYKGTVFKDASNLSGVNNPWLWLPIADEKLKNPDAPTSDLVVTSYNPADDYNFIHQGKYYKFYWREPWFDFGMVPEWKIPMNITGLFTGAENNYEYKNSALDTSWYTGTRVSTTSRNVYYKVNATDPNPGNLYLRGHDLAHPKPEAAVPPLPGMLQYVFDPVRMIGMRTIGWVQTCTGSNGSIPPEETGGVSWGGATGCSTMYVDLPDATREHEIVGADPNRKHHHNMNALYGGYIAYNWSGYYLPLYRAKFSGGYENLINLQNNWKYGTERRTIYFSGTTTAPWYARESLKADGSPAFYGISYYTAPVRRFDYDESLSTEPPPAAPSTYTVNRSDYQEGYRQ